MDIGQEVGGSSSSNMRPVYNYLNLYSTVLTLLYCTHSIVYCILQYCTVFYCIVLFYCIILYNTLHIQRNTVGSQHSDTQIFKTNQSKFI